MCSENHRRQKKSRRQNLGTMNKSNKQKTVKNMVDINSTTSIPTLNINGLNSPIKKKFKVDQKQDPTVCCL